MLKYFFSFLQLFIIRYFVFTTVMATIPITLQINNSIDEDNRTDSDTNLSATDTENELHTDTTTWTPADRKKMQHMTEFHEEYQHVFVEGASIQTIMRRRIFLMNLPMPKSVCKEEMQSTHLDSNEVIIEFMTDAQGNKIKKLKPMLITSKLNREYTQHVLSDADLPPVP